MDDEVMMYVFGIKLTPAWWKLASISRRSRLLTLQNKIKQIEKADGTILRTYSSLRYDVDLILWLSSKKEETILKFKLFVEELFGDCASVEYGFMSICKKGPSESVKYKFFVAYPMKKSNDWYLLPMEKRNKIMSEHIAMARLSTNNNGIISYTTKSFGISDDEFLVLYEVESISHWMHVVEELRQSESRKWITNEKPVLVGIEDESFLYLK